MRANHSVNSHEATVRKTPAQVYMPSSHRYPVKLPSVEYDNGYEVRQARHNGEIK